MLKRDDFDIKISKTTKNIDGSIFHLYTNKNLIIKAFENTNLINEIIQICVGYLLELFKIKISYNDFPIEEIRNEKNYYMHIPVIINNNFEVNYVYYFNYSNKTLRLKREFKISLLHDAIRLHQDKNKKWVTGYIGYPKSRLKQVYFLIHYDNLNFYSFGMNLSGQIINKADPTLLKYLKEKNIDCDRLLFTGDGTVYCFNNEKLKQKFFKNLNVARYFNEYLASFIQK